MGIASGRQQVGGNVPNPSHIGDDVNFFLHLGQLREKFRLRIAFQNICGQGMSFLVGRPQSIHVSLVQEDLHLQDLSGLLCDVLIVAQGQVEQHPDGGSSLHVRKLFQGGAAGDFRHIHVAQNDVFEELGLDPGSAGGSGQNIVDEERQRGLSLGVARRYDLFNDLVQQSCIVNGFGVQA